MTLIKISEIKQIVKFYVLEKIDIDIIDIELYGSRTKEAAREDSDLDILLEYKGNIREDDLFNILNDDPLYIDDIKVDINPITGRTIKEYMKNLF
jgi:predicted nucleotidyltransferase